MQAGLVRNLVVVMVVVIALVVTVATGFCDAAENDELKTGAHAGSEHRSRRVELSDEKIENVMDRLRADNPQEAEEMEKLRRKEPERFQDEIKKLMRKYFGRKSRGLFEHKGSRRGDGMGYHERFGESGRRRRMAREPGERLAMMRQRHAEFIEWLKQNYPEEAERIAAMKEKNPELGMKKLSFGLKKYGRIFEASKENPTLAKVLKQDLELNKEKEKLLEKIRAAKDKDVRTELTRQLRDVLNRKFDLIVRRKEIRYESLLERLKELENHVRKSKARIEKWKDPGFKQENVKAHLKDLLDKSEQFEWD